MSTYPGIVARIVLWTLHHLLAGDLGDEVVDELEHEYFDRAERGRRFVATVWLAGHLVAPSTWRLAFALRRRVDSLATARATRPSMRGHPAGIGAYFLDLQYSARSVLRRPGFAVLTLGTLAVGIGAASSVFGLAEAMLLRHLDVEDGDRLVRVFSVNPVRGLGWFGVSHPDYLELSARADLFEEASFYTSRSLDLSGEGVPERVEAVAVYRRYFQTLGTPATLGRRLEAFDHDPRSPATAVLSESFWDRRFGRDPGVIGRTVRLDGVPHTVIGVIADESAWPAGTQVWTPLRWGEVVPEDATDRSNRAWQMIARLRPGVAVDAASRQVGGLAEAIYARDGIDPREEATSALVVPLHSSEAGEGAGALFATLGAAVFLILLLACMNASGLLLIRSDVRARELSLRAALGAGRTRLAWTLFGECAVLAFLGGGLGLALGHYGL